MIKEDYDIEVAKEYTTLQERIATLEKENAELKKACDETQELLDKQIEATYKLDKENAELKAGRDINVFTKQLTKAKEIIKTFLGFAEAFGYSPSMDKFITEAEQFLNSEVEK